MHPKPVPQQEVSQETPQPVRAKFVCVSKTETNDGYRQRHLYSYKFLPVTSGSPENETFFAYTPSGSIELNTITDGQFEVGREYYLDFTAA